ncbi:MAG TPA: ATP-binding protein, partial [Atopobiaceae bacterium]|nr:ATP-binding protein [Atopobiaceae bacterium]
SGDDEAHSAFATAKVENLVKRANPRYPGADVRRLDFSEECKLDRVKIAERGSNVVIEGLTGSGKAI